jgi:threonine aldolase
LAYHLPNHLETGFVTHFLTLKLYKGTNFMQYDQKKQSTPLTHDLCADFRSDTVSQQTPAMRQAMFEAMVGDDVYGDDPTTTALEQLAAKLLNKEAAIFVPSGNFGNQLALITHCQRGDEVILGDDCHIVDHETGGAAIIAGVQLRTIATQFGVMPLTEIKKRIRTFDDIHTPKTSLICLENAYSSGHALPLDYQSSVYALAKQEGIALHLDGARLFNAATALKVDPAAIADQADSVMFCLSKGLAAPIGSMLVGTHAFITKAKRYRKMMGGGLRQSGFLAAAGIEALNTMRHRLADDHQLADYLSQQLQSIPAIQLLSDTRNINLVWFYIDAKANIDRLNKQLTAHNILVNAPSLDHTGQYLMRLVIHWKITQDDIDRLIAIFKNVLEAPLSIPS